jgi:hydrogen peroxide-dependent heme synthase
VRPAARPGALCFSTLAGVALTPTTGWGVLHLFCRLTPAFDANSLGTSVKSAESDGYQVVPVALLGHKADLGLMVLGPDVWRLRRFQTEAAHAGAVAAQSYVSLTEVSEYASGLPEETRQARLFPQLPPEGKPASCFYPMTKRRDPAPGHNWYALDFYARKELMLAHGRVGRSFAGRILQLITGSTGLDDYEWGVTLFGAHPDDLKDCVYTMRFDEASARFAEFGPFYTGMVGTLDEVLSALA